MPKLRSAETMDKPKPHLPERARRVSKRSAAVSAAAPPKAGHRQTFPGSYKLPGARLSQPQRVRRQDGARHFGAVTSSRQLRLGQPRFGVFKTRPQRLMRAQLRFRNSLAKLMLTFSTESKSKGCLNPSRLKNTKHSGQGQAVPAQLLSSHHADRKSTRQRLQNDQSFL